MNPKIIDNPPKMWWSGDKRVEPYMPKINEALERNGLTGDAKTDCYNRAYEAVYKAIIDATAECACLRADLEKVTAERDEYKETLDQAYKLKDYWKLEAEQYKAEREELIAFLKTRYQSHYYCDDSWYSCPEHPDGCANDMITGCNCGAEKNNEEITNFINHLQERKSATGENIEEVVK